MTAPAPWCDVRAEPDVDTLSDVFAAAAVGVRFLYHLSARGLLRDRLDDGRLAERADLFRQLAERGRCQLAQQRLTAGLAYLAVKLDPLAAPAAALAAEARRRGERRSPATRPPSSLAVGAPRPGAASAIEVEQLGAVDAQGAGAVRCRYRVAGVS